MQRIEEKKTVGRKTDMIRVVSWSELCSDVLGDIIGKLDLADLVRFQAVCKSWHNVYLSNKFHAVCSSLGIKSTSNFSWFVRVYRRNQELTSTLHFHLYAPSHSIDVPISVHSISLRELGVPILSAWSDIRIFCKYSWLFISVNERKEYYPHSGVYFILFSPLTKKFKQLPRLNTSARYIEQTFSSYPESADCVFLLLDARSFGDKILVATCRKDDEEWTVTHFRRDGKIMCSVCMPMYVRGMFYIVSPSGKMASYDVIENKMMMESSTGSGDLAKNYYIDGQTGILFMVNGELFYDFGYRTNPRTKRYDWSNRVWIPVSSLRDSATVNNDKPHSASNMTQFFHSGSLNCALESFDLVRVMRNLPGFIFYSGSSHWNRPHSFFWLEPPLSDTETMHINQVKN